MEIKLYNTFTRKKEIFKPLNPNRVLMYACGPTVYNYIHIGNARPLCVFDVFRKFLIYMGYNVKFVQNFTDIDDKIIRKATEENSDFLSISNKYIKEYIVDARGLGVKEADVHPKATENIKEIIDIIKNLIEQGFAYSADNGDVYFETRKFSNYGKLSHQTLDDLNLGARIKIDEAKKDPVDFVLWKSAKPREPYWNSPWGNGRPGWHIECSAMAQKYLGKTIDIHCGGQDLIFPHHENEIAQSECATGAKFASYWVHNGYINVNSQKMSKSLNNFFTVREISEKYGYEAIRYLMISSHYRSPVNYSEEIMQQCKMSVRRLYTFQENLNFALEKSTDTKCAETSLNLNLYRQRFIEALSDDLNTADAISVVFELVRDVNAGILSCKNFEKETIKNIISLFNELTDVLGILKSGKTSDNSQNEEEINKLIAMRESARKEKNWQLADEIRNKLKEMNVIIEDTPQGTKFILK